MIQIGKYQKESIVRDTSHRERGKGRGDWKGSGSRSGSGGGMSERAGGAETIGIRMKRGKKGDIIAVPPTKGQRPR